MNIIYKSPFDHKCKIVRYDLKQISAQELKKLVVLKEKLSNVNIEFNIVFNGKKLIDNVFAEDDRNIFLQISLPLAGGKGGFGSMLRAIGAQIEKTTNREACRDLSGRRLRYVNEEKRLKDWIKRQAERKEEEKKKKDKLKRMADGNLTDKCEYNDNEFEKFRTEIPDIVEESINQGLQQQADSNDKIKSAGDLKRKIDQEDPPPATSPGPSSTTKDDVVIPTASSSSHSGHQSAGSANKKVKNQHNLWLGIDVGDDSDSDSDSSLGKAEASEDHKLDPPPPTEKALNKS